MNDFDFMMEAISLAKKAEGMGEIPVGAVVVKDGQIIGRGYNTRETDKNPLGHAEMNAILDASKNLGDWRLDGCTLYVTFEPCIMCSSAVSSSRISRVVYGSADKDAGASGGKINVFAYDFTADTTVTPFVLKEECDKLLASFFEKKRKMPRTDLLSENEQK